MKLYRSPFPYLYFYFLAILLAFFSFYLFNPFNNKCIRGDCKNGKGVYVYHSGMKYDGEWKNGKRDGEGTLTYPDGSKYTGEWKNNRMHGKGVKTYADDRHIKEYVGNWKNGNKDGTGTAIFKGGIRYEGEWQNGQIYGHGTITTSDGVKIIGERKNEMLYGTSTEIYPDGRILTVERINDKRNGHGVMTYPDGTKVTEEWINNKLVGSPGFYLFRGFEFTNEYHIIYLCNKIKEDITISLNAKENTIDWLNKLLTVPNLYDRFNKKTKASEFSQEITSLIERTEDVRSKRFADLDSDNRRDIVKLNRLLLEHFYPFITPKNQSARN